MEEIRKALSQFDINDSWQVKTFFGITDYIQFNKIYCVSRCKHNNLCPDSYVLSKNNEYLYKGYSKEDLIKTILAIR